MYSLYLRCGGINDILDMNYWRFLVVCRTITELSKTANGGVWKEGLSASQKDMIARKKKQGR